MSKTPLAIAALALAGCGPIEFIANVPFEAAGQVAEAKHVHGEKYAPYETTAANEYLHKSRELAGSARYHASIEFARKATKLAQEAKKISADKASLPDEKNEENTTAPAAGTPSSPPTTVAPAAPTNAGTHEVTTVHTDKADPAK